MWCPEGYCDRYKRHEGGWCGPSSTFHECFDPSSNTIVKAVWTGSLTRTKAPKGWVSNPDRCDEERIITDPHAETRANAEPAWNLRNLGTYIATTFAVCWRCRRTSTP